MVFKEQQIGHKDGSAEEMEELNSKERTSVFFSNVEISSF